MSRILGVIPARYDSVRFPGKPLAMIGNQTMIERVYRQVEKSTCLSSIVVATDDERIHSYVISFGGKSVITSKNHENGTSRCVEALQKMGNDFDAVMNIQGDEPFIHPESIDAVGKLITEGQHDIATLAFRGATLEEYQSPHCVKVVTDELGKALYFSRAPIPAIRDGIADDKLRDVLLHVGLYAFRKEVVMKLPELAVSPLETAEKLEQLCWLWHGMTIKVGLINHRSVGIDTPEDLEKAIRHIS